jgi:ubiquinone/menaquinone biosynthesis C-methylase UbiE
LKPQVNPIQYDSQVYDSKERFISYWHQINEILSLKPKNVLEIGIGNGFVSKYLKSKGLNIITIDIDERLKPDVVGNGFRIPFIDRTFEIVACYELLEHLQYQNFCPVLKELCRVSKRNIIISLPDVTTVYRLNIELPRISPIKILIPHPLPRPVQHAFDGEHYWEIGKKGFSLKKIVGDIRKTGIKILKTYRVFEFYYHRFFVLERFH